MYWPDNICTKLYWLLSPIEVLFEGANLDVYKSVKEFKSKELYNHINQIPEKFAYLFVGHWLQGELGQDRKNVGLLVKAFYEVFKGKSNSPALILKTSIGKGSHMDRREIQKRINSIKKSVPGEKLPHIYLIHGDLSDSEMNDQNTDKSWYGFVIKYKGVPIYLESQLQKR